MRGIIAQGDYTARPVQQNVSRMDRGAPGTGRPRAASTIRALAVLATFGALAWLSLAEWKILTRLYADPPSLAFVVESVRGVLGGTPVSKSWAHRIATPYLVGLLGEPLGGTENEAVLRFTGLALLAANALLFALLRGRGASRASAALGVVSFGLARLVLAYKLEYPWDGVDQLVFLAFGAWAARGGSLLRFAPVLVVGALNHETILYVPLYFLLAAITPSSERPPPERAARTRLWRGLEAGAVLAALAAAIGGLRALRYVGPPSLPGQIFEVPTPVVENHLHVAHNLRQLFVRNWIDGRAHVTIGFLAAVTMLVVLVRKPQVRVPALWSLVVLATVVAFGYVTETRHYLVLVAFWIAHAWRDPIPARTAAT